MMKVYTDYGPVITWEVGQPVPTFASGALYITAIGLERKLILDTMAATTPEGLAQAFAKFGRVLAGIETPNDAPAATSTPIPITFDHLATDYPDCDCELCTGRDSIGE